MLGNYLVSPDAENESYIGGLEVFHQIHCLVCVHVPYTPV
jgi:hypothetical protein